MKSKKTLLFDVGGVILFCDHMKICRRLSKLCRFTPKEIYGRIFTSGLERLYDEGRLSTDKFHRKVLQALEVEIPFNRFSEIWSDIYRENEAVSRLVRELKKKYRICFLSNTNELHYRFISKKFGIMQEFDGRILSFEIGHRKPAVEIFRAAPGVTQMPASRHLFIDDKEEYVQAAKACGMAGIVFKSPAQLKKELQKNGFSMR